MNYHSLMTAPFSVGVELPLDNDWSKAGQASRLQDGRAFGVPDMKEHRKRIQLADQLGFRAAWVHDVPLYDPDFGAAWPETSHISALFIWTLVKPRMRRLSGIALEYRPA